MEDCKNNILIPQKIDDESIDQLNELFIKKLYEELKSSDELLKEDFISTYYLFNRLKDRGYDFNQFIKIYIYFKLSSDYCSFINFFKTGCEYSETINNLSEISLDNYQYATNKLNRITGAFKEIHENNLYCMLYNISYEMLDNLSKRIDVSFQKLRKPIIDYIYEIYDFKEKSTPANILCFDLKVSGLTLEEIAKQFGVTRERIRQRIKKIMDIYQRKLIYLENRIINVFKVISDNDYFISFDTIDDVFSKKIADDLRFILSKIDFEIISYDVNYDCLCIDNEYYKINNRIDNIISNLPDVLNEEQYESLVSLISNKFYDGNNRIGEMYADFYYSLNNNYRHKNKKISVKNKVLLIINKYFNDGIYPYSPSELTRLRDLFEKEFNDDSFYSDRFLQAIIQKNCCLIDRGKYDIFERVNRLSDELYSEIFNYIIRFDYPLSYSVIFDNFKKKLSTYGVNNHYYLQGLLKLKYRNDLIFTKDYIYNDMSVKIEGDIRNICSSFDVDFTVNDIIKLRPSYNYNIVNNVINNLDDYYRVNFKTFRKVSSLELSESDQTSIKYDFLSFIQDKRIINVKDLFTLLSSKSKYMTKYEINNPRCLYSILLLLLRDEYNFSYPYIAIKGADIDLEIEKYNAIFEVDEDDKL